VVNSPLAQQDRLGGCRYQGGADDSLAVETQLLPYTLLDFDNS
jgi:hypothetical protein